MLAGITEIAIVSSPDYLLDYRDLFGDGSHLGPRVDYVEQPRPEGLPQAFTLARDWIAGKAVTLILGDNIFYGNGLVALCRGAVARVSGAGGATVFGYHVPDPGHYGVIGFDAGGRVTSLEEKPASAKSNCAMTGLYVFDERMCELAAGLQPSARGELEITDLARAYLGRGDLHIEQMGRGYAWLDTGTHDSLLEAAEFVRTVQHRQGIQIACLEEIAYHLRLIDADQARRLAAGLVKSPHGAAILHSIEGR